MKGFLKFEVNNFESQKLVEKTLITLKFGESKLDCLNIVTLCKCDN